MNFFKFPFFKFLSCPANASLSLILFEFRLAPHRGKTNQSSVLQPPPPLSPTLLRYYGTQKKNTFKRLIIDLGAKKKAFAKGQRASGFLI